MSVLSKGKEKDLSIFSSGSGNSRSSNRSSIVNYICAMHSKNIGHFAPKWLHNVKEATDGNVPIIRIELDWIDSIAPCCFNLGEVNDYCDSNGR